MVATLAHEALVFGPKCVKYPEIEPKPGIHTPNCLKKWTEEQEGLAPNLRKPPPSPPPGSVNHFQLDFENAEFELETKDFK